MNERLEKILKQVISIGSALILLIPIFVYRGVMYPYIFSKVIIFQIIVEILFSTWLFLIFLPKNRGSTRMRETRINADEDRNYRPNFKNPLILTLTIFIGILILTMFTGVDIQRSFWSNQERMNGVLTLTHFWLWFLILTSTFGSKRGSTQMNTQIDADEKEGWRDWKKMIWASLICSFLVGLYGLGQKLDLNFLLKEADLGRMSATLGNPIFLGTYAMFNIFLAGFSFLREKKLWWRVLLMLFLVFNTVIMFLTATRGVIIAFSLSLFLFILYLLFRLVSRKKRFFLITLCIFFTLGTIAGLFFLQTQRNKPWMLGAPAFIQRLSYLTYNVPQRTVVWQVAWQGFKERPILGWGWENYNILFNKKYNPKILEWGLESTWVDRSHNQIIDLLALTGVVGTTVYLLFYGGIFYLIFKKIKELKKNKGASSEILSFVILALLFFAYFIQNFTVFDNPASLIVFYFALGFICLLTRKNVDLHKTDDNFYKQQLNKLQPKQFPLPILILIVVIFFPLAIYKFNIEPWQQSRLATLGVSAGKVNLESSLSWYQKSLAKSVFTNAETRLQLTKTISGQKENDEFFKEGLTFAISEMEKNIKERPQDVRYYIYLGQLYNLGGRSKKEYLDKAEETFEEAKKLSPQRQQIYFGLAETKVLKGDFKTAIEIAKTAVDFDPNAGDSHKVLGLIYLRNNDLKNGLQEIETAGKLIDIYVDTPVTLYIATAYFKQGNIGRAIEVSKDAQWRDPQNVTIYIQLATLYKESGEKDMAIKSVQKAVELNPTLAQGAEIFIQSLK